MGKQGPCCHCGITSTPLWRNGPPEKPVLCNACGSRWRTKGTLENYTPLHARSFQPFDTEESDYTQEWDVPSKTMTKNIDIKANGAAEIKRQDNFVAYDLCPPGLEDDTSNRSSSESAISCSESCVQLGSTEGNEISGSVQFNLWDPYIPSKKRSRTRHHSPSPVEKLRRNLVDILQELEPSSLTTFSEEVLIFEKDDSRFSAEIGLGGVLLKPSIFFTREESEASSLVIENDPSCLNNGCVESLLLRSQSSEFIKSKESYRLIQETGDTEGLKINVAKPSALRNKYLGNTLLKNPDILQTSPSPHMQISWESQNVKSFTPSKEMAETTSCSSCLDGDGNSLPLERNLGLPYLPASGGPSFDTIEGFKTPKEQMVVQKTLSSTSMSAFSIDRVSSILPLTEFRAKTSDGDKQMQAHPGNNIPVVKFPSPLALQKESNDAERDSAPETNQYPNNIN